MNKFWRVGITLSFSAILGLILFVGLFFYYDDLRTSLTYDQLDNLTRTQIITAIVKADLVALALVSLGIVWIYVLNKMSGIARSGIAAAICVWCFMFVITVTSSIYHYKKVIERMGETRIRTSDY